MWFHGGLMGLNGIDWLCKQIAIERGHRKFVSFPRKDGVVFFFHRYVHVYQRVCFVLHPPNKKILVPKKERLNNRKRRD